MEECEERKQRKPCFAKRKPVQALEAHGHFAQKKAHYGRAVPPKPLTVLINKVKSRPTSTK